MVMKEKTWFNIVNIRFYLHELALKDKWQYFQIMVYRQSLLDYEKEKKHQYWSHMMRVILTQMMKRERYGGRRENHFYDQKEKEKELWYPNFSSLVKDCASLTLCLIINLFKIKIGLLIKIKNLVDIVLSYLNMVKIITKIKTK